MTGFNVVGPSWFYYFVIVGANDELLFDVEFCYKARSEFLQHHSSYRHQLQFVIFGSLDLVDINKGGSENLYLKTVDSYNEFFVSAYITHSNYKFVLVHDVQNDENIRNFFNDVYEQFAFCKMNPMNGAVLNNKGPLINNLFDKGSVGSCGGGPATFKPNVFGNFSKKVENISRKYLCPT